MKKFSFLALCALCLAGTVAGPTDVRADESVRRLIASGPTAGHRLRIPAPAEYIDRLPAPAQTAWHAFRQRHPDVDPTALAPFHDALMTERGRYGVNLTAEAYETYHAWLAEVETMGGEMVRTRGRLLGIPLGGIDKEGHGYALIGFDGAKPLYTFTQNHDAAVSSAASFVRRNAWFDPVFGPDIDGSGYYANVNDHGEIYWHTEFQNDSETAWRIIEEIREPWYPDPSRTHMTHVAGTISARGYTASAMGMAPAVNIYTFIQQFNSDVTGYGMNWPGRPGRSIVGNTSLGTADADFSGVYTAIAHSFDQVLYDTPYYLHFYAAGNAGSSYFTISRDRQAAKNNVTVGAVHDVSRDADGVRTGGGGIASFSSRGPMRDGRIKPDIVGNGVGLYSPRTETGYASISGTSMASPNAAGSAILLQDYFGKLFPGHYMRAATLKTLIINTAEDLGTPGPDYHYGWGLINVLESGRIIQYYALNAASRTLIEDVLPQGQTVAIPYEYTGTGPIRATLGWTDPPGAPQTNNTVTIPALVNDLNLRLIGPDATVHLPFVMPYVIGTADKDPFDSSLLGADAVTGTNFTDNTIQVLIAAPVAGEYTLEISHAGSLTGGSQQYSLVVSGLICTLPPEPPTISAHPTVGDNSDFFAFELLGAGFMLGTDLILRRNGSEPLRGYAVETTGNRLFARFDTDAMAKGFWDVVVRNPDGRETVSSERFLLSGTELTVGGSFTAFDKVYDANTQATINLNNLSLIGIQPGKEDVVLVPVVAFGNNAVGVGKTVALTEASYLTGADAGNYTLSLDGSPAATASITARGLTLDGLTASDKMYDGTTDAVIVEYGELTGIIGDDIVTLDTATAVASFDTPDVGNDKTVTLTGLTMDGEDAGNYTIGNPATTANITPAVMTVTFNGQDGMPPDPENKQVTYGEPYGPLATTTRTGYTFTGWWTEAGGWGSRITNATVVSTLSDHTLYAHWTINEHTLTVMSAHGDADPVIGTHINLYGTVLTNSVDALVTLGGTQYVNVGWTMTGHEPLAGIANEFSMTVTNDAALTWQWATNFWLEPLAGANGSVDVSSQWVPAGGDVVITAAHDAHHHFVEWIGDTDGCPIDGNEITAVMDQARRIEAVFAIDTYTLTYAAGTGGAIDGETPQTVAHGQSGTAILAVRAPGYHFTQWSDGLTDNPRQDTNVTNDLTVTAGFALNPHTLTVESAHGDPDPAAGTHTNLYGTVLTNSVDALVTLGGTQYVNVGWTLTGHEPAAGTTNEFSMTVTNDAVLTWQWSTNYWLEPVAGANGSVDASNQWVAAGGDVVITATPDAHHHFVEWSGDTDGCPIDGNEITAVMDQARRIEALFAIDIYTLTYAADTGGAIDGETSQTVDHGQSGTAILAVSDTGYHFTQWSDGLTDNPRQDTNVTNDLTVTAGFALNPHTLTVESAHGDPDPAVGTHANLYGTVLTNSVDALVTLGGTQYVNVGWTLTGHEPAAGTTNEFSMTVTNDAVLTWQWATNYWLEPLAGANGSVDVSNQWVSAGGEVVITATPDAHHHFVEWIGDTDGCPIDGNEITAVMDQARRIEAVFAIDTYTLTYSAGAGGTIDGEISQTVDHGQSGTAILAVSDTGYHFTQWSDGLTDNPRQDINVTNDLTVTAGFALNPHTLSVISAHGDPDPVIGTHTNLYGTVLTNSVDALVTLGGTQYVSVGWTMTGHEPAAGTTNQFSMTVTNDAVLTWQWATNYWLEPLAGANGSVDVSNQWVSAGGDVVITATPDAHHHFVEWIGDTDGCPIDGNEITAVMDQARRIEAVFAIDTYTLTYSAGTGGTIDGETSQTVDHGENGTTVTAVSDPGYSFTQWSDGLTGNPRQDTNVTNDLTVTAGFALNPHTLTVISAHGDPDPAVGKHTNLYGAVLTNSVDALVTLGGTQYVSVGWTLTGHEPAAGTTNEFSMTVTNDAVLTWQWATNYWLEPLAGANGSVDASNQWVSAGGDIVITATSDLHHHFVEWTGDTDGCPIDGNEVTAVMDRARRIEAVFAIDTYTLTYAADTGGAIDGETSQTVDHGENGTTVTAVSDTGYSFTQWSDGLTDNPRQDTNVTNDLTVTAGFALNPHTLTVISAHGDPDPVADIHTNLYGTVLTNSVDALVTLGGTQYVNVGWTMTGHEPLVGITNEFSMTVTNDAVLTWQWATNYWLTTAASGEGGVDQDGAWIVSGSNVTLFATASSGWSFAEWTGDVPAAQTNDNPLTLLMDQSRMVTAIFTAAVTSVRHTPILWYLYRGMEPSDYELETWEELDEFDSDGDGMLNWQEYVAGTEPLDFTDRFGVEYILDEDGEKALWFMARVGRVYRIKRSDDLRRPIAEWELVTEYEHHGGSNTLVRIVDNHGPGANYFYRLEVRVGEE